MVTNKRLDESIKTQLEKEKKRDRVNVTGDLIEDLVALAKKVNHNCNEEKFRKYLKGFKILDDCENVSDVLKWVQGDFTRISSFSKAAGGYYAMHYFIEEQDPVYYTTIVIWKHLK